MEKLEELKIVKEYLLEEIDKLNTELNSQTQKAIQGNVSHYVINIFTAKFEERKEHLKRLLDNVLNEIKVIKTFN